MCGFYFLQLEELYFENKSKIKNKKTKKLRPLTKQAFYKFSRPKSTWTHVEPPTGGSREFQGVPKMEPPVKLPKSLPD